MVSSLVVPVLRISLSKQVGLPLGSKLDSASLAYGAALLAEGGQCVEGTFLPCLFYRSRSSHA